MRKYNKVASRRYGVVREPGGCYAVAEETRGPDGQLRIVVVQGGLTEPAAETATRKLVMEPDACDTDRD